MLLKRFSKTKLENGYTCGQTESPVEIQLEEVILWKRAAVSECPVAGEWTPCTPEWDRVRARAPQGGDSATAEVAANNRSDENAASLKPGRVQVHRGRTGKCQRPENHRVDSRVLGYTHDMKFQLLESCV